MTRVRHSSAATGVTLRTVPHRCRRWLGWATFLWMSLASATCADSGLATGVSPVAGGEASLWQYGAYLDGGYVLNVNFPENHLWRSRGTALRHNEFAPNMALAYVRKDASESSRWGMELGAQGGYDSERFALLQGSLR